MAEKSAELWTSLREAGRRTSDFLFRGRAVGVLILVTIVILTGVVIHLVNRRLLLSSHFRVEPSTLRFNDLPAWAPERIADELRDRCRSLPARPVLDPNLESDLRGALLGHPWVAKVEAIKRRFPNFVEAELRLRRPLARVEVRSRTLTVDAEGVVLEDIPARVPEGVAYILRAIPKAAGEIPKPGQKFTAAPILHGLAVVREVSTFSDHVGAGIMRGCEVDVSNVGRRDVPEITIRLTSGTEVRWGSAPGPAAPAELPVVRKLDGLRDVDDRYPGLKGVKWVDVTTYPAVYAKDG